MKPKLIVRCRKSHEQSYASFYNNHAWRDRDDYGLETYQPTFSGAKEALEKPAESPVVLDCALPMAMALVSEFDDLKIVGFLDVANVKKRQGSLRLYYHKELRPGTEVELFVPSKQSMTSVVASHLLRKRGVAPKIVEKGGFDGIIGDVAKQRDLRAIAWVLDEDSPRPAEATDDRSPENGIASARDRPRESDLKTALGDRFGEIEPFDAWTEFFKEDRGSPEFMTAHIPGMILVAEGLGLRKQGARDAIHNFLSDWGKARPHERYPFVEFKALGPFSWDSFSDLLSFISFSKEVFRIADSEVGIKRPLLIHRDFDDVTPRGAPSFARVRRNLCHLLTLQASEFSSSASRFADGVGVDLVSLKEAVSKLDAVVTKGTKLLSRLEAFEGEQRPLSDEDLDWQILDGLFVDTRNAEEIMAECFRSIEMLTLQARSQKGK